MDNFGISEVKMAGRFLKNWQKLAVGYCPIDQQIKRLQQRGLHQLQLDFHEGYPFSPSDLSILNEFDNVQAVSCSARFENIHEINEVSALLSLRDWGYKRPEIKWGTLSHLRELRLFDYGSSYHPRYHDLQFLEHLETRHLPKAQASFAALPLTSLKTLGLSSSPVEYLDDLKDAENLEQLLLSNMRKLACRSLEFELPNLERLELINCPSLHTLEFIQNFSGLKLLRVEGCQRISSLECLRGHPTLRHIVGSRMGSKKLSRHIYESIPHLEFVSPALLSDEFPQRGTYTDVEFVEL